MTTVRAYYFPGWGGTNPDPWAEVKNGFMERAPAYGCTDEDRQIIIDRHLTKAGANGINVLACCWYGDSYLTYGADRLAASKAKSPVKWSIVWCNHFAPMAANTSSMAYLLTTVRQAAARMVGDRYWTRNGRPVFEIFSPGQLDDVIRVTGGHDETYLPSLDERASLIAQVRAAMGNDPFIVLHAATSTGWLEVDGIDAGTHYSNNCVVDNGIVRPATTYAELVAGLQQIWDQGVYHAQATGKEFWPVGMVGWAPAPRGLPAQSCIPTDSEFAAHCNAWVAATQAPTARDVGSFYAWNEHTECRDPFNPTAGRGNTMLTTLNASLSQARLGQSTHRPIRSKHASL